MRFEIQAFTPAQGSLKTLFPTKRTACQQAVGTRGSVSGCRTVAPALRQPETQNGTATAHCQKWQHHLQNTHCPIATCFQAASNHHPRQPENSTATARHQMVYSTRLCWLAKYRRAADAPSRIPFQAASAAQSPEGSLKNKNRLVLRQTVFC